MHTQLKAFLFFIILYRDLSAFLRQNKADDESEEDVKLFFDEFQAIFEKKRQFLI